MSRVCWVLVSALLALPSSAFAQVPAASTRWTLSVGEQRVLPAANVHSYSEGVPGVVDVRLTKDAASFVVVGQRPGHTTLLLILDDGRQQLYEVSVQSAITQAPDDVQRAVLARDNVRLDFYFVQVSKAYRDRIGLGWPGSIGGSMSASFDLKAGALTDASALVSDQALPRLDMAEAQGWAKLLRQAAFVTANGTEAKWTGGGEINVPVEGLSGSLSRITFGTEVHVLPRYDRQSGRMELTIHADVSDLASDQGTGVPGRVTSTLDSVVNIELGQSVVLAGLRARSSAHDTAGIPLLSRIPLLGGLFGSTSDQTHDVESLVFIVPSVVDATSLDARAAIAEALADFESYAGDLERTKLTHHLLEPAR
jgi:pilus assembly protein CpaC